MVGFTLAVPVKSEKRTLSLMSSAPRSASNDSGTLSGSHMTSTVWRTTFNTPPFFRPGDVASFRNVTLTATRMGSPAASRWKSTCSGLSETGWNCTARIRARWVLPPTDSSNRRERQPPRTSSRVTSRGSRAMSSGVCLAP